MEVGAVLGGGDVTVVGGVRGSCLTYTVASTGLENTLRSFLGILWKLVVFQEFRVRTQSQDLMEEDKTTTTYLTLISILTHSLCMNVVSAVANIMSATCLFNTSTQTPLLCVQKLHKAVLPV